MLKTLSRFTLLKEEAKIKISMSSWDQFHPLIKCHNIQMMRDKPLKATLDANLGEPRLLNMKRKYLRQSQDTNLRRGKMTN